MSQAKLLEKPLNKELEELLDDISAYRDINNDFPNRDFEKELGELENLALKLFKLKLAKYEGYSRVKVAVIGNFSSGKSTFINSLLGAEVCPVKVDPTTSSVTKFVYGDTEEIFLIKNDGSKEKIDKEKYLNLCQHQTKNMENTKAYFFEYRYPSPILKNIELYDTPGFENKKNPNDEKITKEIAVKQADVILFIQDIQKGTIEESTKKKIKELREIASAKDWYLIFNKADTKPKEDLEKIKANILSLEIAKIFKGIFFYSAKKVMDTLKTLNTEKHIVDFKNWLEQLDEGNHAAVIEKASTINNGSNNNSNSYLGNILGDLFAEIEDHTVKITANDKTFEFVISNNSDSSFIDERERLLNIFKEISPKKEKYITDEINKTKSVYTAKKEETISKIEEKVKPEIFYPELIKLKNSLEILKKEFHLQIPDSALDSLEVYCEVSLQILFQYLKDFNLSEEIKKQVIQSYSQALRKFSQEMRKRNVSNYEIITAFSNIILANILDNLINQIQSYATFKTREVIEKIQKLKSTKRCK